MVRLALVLTLTLLGSVGHASAAVIIRDIELDPAAAPLIRFYETPDRSALDWRPQVSVDPIQFNTADEFLFRVRFANNRVMTLTDLGLGYNSGSEIIRIDAYFDSSSRVEWVHRSTFKFIGVDGDLHSNPIDMGLTSGSGSAIVTGGRSFDLTDTSFSFSGFDVAWSFSSLEIQGDDVFDRLKFFLVAEDISFGTRQIPEPSSLFAGLSALAIIVLLERDEVRLSR